MGCKNCRDFDINACTDIISSTCVSWQGDDDEDLEICVGDSLTYVGNIILAKIKDLLAGRGILLPDLTIDDCEYIEDLLGVDEKNLLNILRVYKEAICELKEASDLNIVNLATFMTVADYTLGCLDPLVDPCDGPITFHTLIQTIIDKICALQEQYDTIADSLLTIVEDTTGNFLLNSITSCGGNGISRSGSGASAIITFEALVPPYAPILYVGSLAYFSPTGVGLVGTPMCGWYLCNGSNGTPTSSSLAQNLAGTLKYIMRLT